jgi:NADH:ubiquinone oxidoreductase subunit 5 (subunit L)/multisubunit Na+/H+ antiporter MnhA subunit
MELGNKIIINVCFKEDFFNNLLALVMTLGSVIVTSFSFFEMRNDKEGANFIIILGYFMVFMLILLASSNLLMFYLG